MRVVLQINTKEDADALELAAASVGLVFSEGAIEPVSKYPIAVLLPVPDYLRPEVSK